MQSCLAFEKNKTAFWNRVAILCISVSILGGIFLRIQYSGWLNVDWIDLRRAHSHLGFYGFLFPVLWGYLGRTNKNFWLPGRTYFWGYCLLVGISTMGFATAGYGRVAHISSFFVLLFWLVFALKNLALLKRVQESFLNIIPLAIFMAAMAIGVVLASFMGASLTPLIVVRVFLTLLLFGVFAPLSMTVLTDRKPNGYLWLAGVLGFGLSLAIESVKVLQVMPALLSVLILYLIYPSLKISLKPQNRIRWYWVSLALIFICMSLGVVPNNHFSAVSGVHFFVFLIMVPTFLRFRNQILGFLYEVLALSMIALIFSQNLMEWDYILNQKSLAVVSALMGGVFFLELPYFLRIKNREHL